MFAPTKLVALLTAVLSVVAQPVSDSITASPSSKTYVGDGYLQFATGLSGACGIVNTDDEDFAGVANPIFNSFPGFTGGDSTSNPLCGKTAKVTHQDKTITVKLTDRCEFCSHGDLGLSVHALNQLVGSSEGKVNGISWVLVD